MMSGEPHNPESQKRIMMAALDLLAVEAREPRIATFL